MTNEPLLLKDITPGAEGTYIDDDFVLDIDGTLYFTAEDDAHGEELWKSDGTAEGTVLVKDINPGSDHSDASPEIEIDGTLYFSADDGINGYGLWKSDGTAEGTVLVKDIYPDPEQPYPDGFYPGDFAPGILTEVNGTLYFTADDGIHGEELWKSDGTAEGTVLVKDITPGAEGTSIDDDFVLDIDGTLYFTAEDDAHGEELWKSDGTAEGTVLVKDINPGSDHSDANPEIEIDGTLYFSADDGINGYGLWKSDGTAEGTVLVKDIYPDPEQPYPDGFYPGDFAPNILTEVNGTLYFTADDGIHGEELWKSDGTAEGTVLVKDITPGAEGTSIDDDFVLDIDGTLYFQAEDDAHGEELWKSDGTAEGTVLVKDINPGSEDSDANPEIEIDGTLYFSADDGINGYGLWKSDGTAEGTVLVKDIYPDPEQPYPDGFYPGDFAPNILTEVNGTLYFTADDGIHGEELWSLMVHEPIPVMLPDMEDGMVYNAVPAGEGTDVKTTLSENIVDLGTDAVYDNLVGFYEVTDTDGGIDTDGDGVADLLPEVENGYAKAALENAIPGWQIRAGSEGDPGMNTTVEEFGDVVIAGGKMYAPFAIANGGAVGVKGYIEAEEAETDGIFNDAATDVDDLVAYFAYQGANPDGAVHIKALGDDLFGFEDLPANLDGISDNDYNDAIFKFNFEL